MLKKFFMFFLTFMLITALSACNKPNVTSENQTAVSNNETESQADTSGETADDTSSQLEESKDEVSSSTPSDNSDESQADTSSEDVSNFENPTSLSSELIKRIKNDWVYYISKGNPYSIDDVKLYYYGTYNEYMAFSISDPNILHPADIETDWFVDGVKFKLGSHKTFVLWKNGNFIYYKDAYTQGLISKDDLQAIADDYNNGRKDNGRCNSYCNPKKLQSVRGGNFMKKIISILLVLMILISNSIIVNASKREITFEENSEIIVEETTEIAKKQFSPELSKETLANIYNK